MIEIILSDSIFDNDIYPLVKAFYPSEEIKTEHRTVTDSAIPCADGEPGEPGEPREPGEPEVYKEDISYTAGNSMISEIPVISRIIIDMLIDRIKITIVLQTGEYVKDSTKTLPVTEDKSAYKNALKRLLYRMLSCISGRKLPWGTLTGIRPTKLAYDMLDRGITCEEILNHYREEYLCSDEKALMCIQIAQRERQLLSDIDYKNGYSLYIGIPFCPSTCLYCSFPSYNAKGREGLVNDYLNALEREIIAMAGCFRDKKLNAVYFGGGTPTTLTAKQLDKLLGTVKSCFDFSSVREFCVEAGRPDSITQDKLAALKIHGVNRIAINPQSMQPGTLQLIGRNHTVSQVREAFGLAREAGFDNINMDIIIGLPGETPEDVADTLSQIKELEPEGLTVHTLALKRAARLNTQGLPADARQAEGVSEMLDITIKFAKENGYLPYYLYRQKNMADNLENIGYAKKGREGLYNILIMEEKQTILALGAAAITKYVFPDNNRIERIDNVKSITDYTGRIEEMISRKQLFLAKCITGGKQ